MAPLPPLAINGKFLAAPPTGVHRVAAELANALADIARAQPGRLDLELWVPRDGMDRAADLRLAPRLIGPLKHIPWEQLTIAPRDPGRLLLNLCNIGPIARTNAISMIHDAQVHLTPASYSRPFRLWYKTLQPVMGRRHRGILTVSHYSATQIARVGIAPPERIAVVHNGLDHMLRVASEAPIVARLGLTHGRYVVALASTQAHKNIAILARAFADARLAGVPLVLVGAADRAAFAAAGIDLPPATVFAGRVSDGALRALYESALCLAFPSRTEGFGLPPGEAMLVGCPAVVAPCGALPEVCGDAALVAGPDDPGGWTSHIAALANDPALRDRLAEAGQVQAARFTWAAAGEQLLAAVARLVAGR